MWGCLPSSFDGPYERRSASLHFSSCLNSIPNPLPPGQAFSSPVRYGDVVSWRIKKIVAAAPASGSRHTPNPKHITHRRAPPPGPGISPPCRPAVQRTSYYISMPTLHQQEDQEDRGPCLLPLTVLYQSRALATCLHAHDLSCLSRSSHACQSFWSQVQSLHVPFFQYSLPSSHAVNKTRTDGFRRACHQGQLINLVNLSLHGANLVDKDLERLAKDVLPFLPQLEILDLSHNPSLGYPGLTHIANSPHGFPPKLRDLRLAHNSNMCRGARGGAHLGQLLLLSRPGLACLELTQTGVTHETLGTAVRLLNHVIERSREAENEILQLLPRLGFSSLRELRLGQNILQGVRGGQALTEVLLLNSNNSKSHPLEILVLDDCYIGDEGLTFFAESALMLGQFWSLRELHLQNNRCGAGGARTLGKACVEGLPALEFLGLRMNMMGNEGALALVEGMVMVGEEGEEDGREGGEEMFLASLTKLVEGENGREGGEQRCLPRLKRLDLSHNMIDAKGANYVLAVLMAPGRCPSLGEVDLSHNAVREKEARLLQQYQFSISSSTTSVNTDGTFTITTTVNGNKLSDVNVILSPTGLYCQVVLEGEEEEIVGGREGGKRKRPDALMLLNWTVQSVVGMIKFAITQE